MVEYEIDNDIIKWYLVGCQIVQNPTLNEFNKNKLKEFLKTLTLMAGDYPKVVYQLGTDSKEYIELKEKYDKLMGIGMITAKCHICNSIQRIKQIHIDIPIVLVLECGHRIRITDLGFGISQNLT